MSFSAEATCLSNLAGASLCQPLNGTPLADVSIAPVANMASLPTFTENQLQSAIKKDPAVCDTSCLSQSYLNQSRLASDPTDLSQKEAGLRDNFAVSFLQRKWAKAYGNYAKTLEANVAMAAAAGLPSYAPSCDFTGAFQGCTSKPYYNQMVTALKSFFPRADGPDIGTNLNNWIKTGQTILQKDVQVSCPNNAKPVSFKEFFQAQGSRKLKDASILSFRVNQTQLIDLIYADPQLSARQGACKGNLRCVQAELVRTMMRGNLSTGDDIIGQSLKTNPEIDSMTTEQLLSSGLYRGFAEQIDKDPLSRLFFHSPEAMKVLFEAGVKSEGPAKDFLKANTLAIVEQASQKSCEQLKATTMQVLCADKSAPDRALSTNPEDFAPLFYLSSTDHPTSLTRIAQLSVACSRNSDAPSYSFPLDSDPIEAVSFMSISPWAYLNRSEPAYRELINMSSFYLTATDMCGKTITAQSLDARDNSEIAYNRARLEAVRDLPVPAFVADPSPVPVKTNFAFPNIEVTPQVSLSPETVGSVSSAGGNGLVQPGTTPQAVTDSASVVTPPASPVALPTPVVSPNSPVANNEVVTPAPLPATTPVVSSTNQLSSQIRELQDEVERMRADQAAKAALSASQKREADRREEEANNLATYSEELAKSNSNSNSGASTTAGSKVNERTPASVGPQDAGPRSIPAAVVTSAPSVSSAVAPIPQGTTSFPGAATQGIVEPIVVPASSGASRSSGAGITSARVSSGGGLFLTRNALGSPVVSSSNGRGVLAGDSFSEKSLAEALNQLDRDGVTAQDLKIKLVGKSVQITVGGVNVLVDPAKIQDEALRRRITASLALLTAREARNRLDALKRYLAEASANR